MYAAGMVGAHSHTTNAIDGDNLCNEGMQTHYKKKNSMYIVRGVMLERVFMYKSDILSQLALLARQGLPTGFVLVAGTSDWYLSIIQNLEIHLNVTSYLPEFI